MTCYVVDGGEGDGSFLGVDCEELEMLAPGLSVEEERREKLPCACQRSESHALPVHYR